MRRMRWWMMVLASIGGCWLPGVATAREPQPDYSLVHPTTSGGRYVTIHESETLYQWRYNLGVFFDYARKPLQIQNLTTGQRLSIINDTVTATAVGAVGFTNWWEAGLAVPVSLHEGFFDPNQQIATGGAAPKQNRAGMGDLKFETKFRLLDIDRYKVGLAVAPYLIFPTGRKGSFISNDSWTGGGKAVIEGNINDRAWLSMNVGYQYVRQSNQYFARNANAVYDDILSLGLGARVKLTDDWVLLGEALTETNVKTAYQHIEQTPLLVMAGAQWTPQKNPSFRGLNMTLMGGAGVTRGVGAPQAQVVVGINYRKPKIVELTEAKNVADVKVEEKIVITQRIHFEFNRSVIRPISFPILDDVAELLRQNAAIRRVQVEGHTDWVGGDAYNQHLSESRARAVVDYLVRKGVEPHRLLPVGYGKSRPIADNNTTEGRAKNRRTEFTVVD